MDNTLHSMAVFASKTENSSIPPAVVDLTTRHLVDAVACGAGAFSVETVRKIRRAIGAVSLTAGAATDGASAYGIEAPTLPEFAAFANASTNRYLDFNDFGPAGHPSDMMPSQLAVAESVGATGADVIRGIFVAYEVATALADAVPFTEVPFDVGLYYSAGAAAGMATIMGMSPEEIGHAISLSVVPSLPLRITRRSPISEWRSSATAHACMAAAFACRLAASGLTGPPEPFEGEGGLFEMLGHTPSSPPALALHHDGTAPSAIERGSLKRYQACFLAQSAIDAARRVRTRVNVPPEGIRRVSVGTTRDTWWYVGGGAGDERQKWSPTTRETADHSIPFIVANVLLSGDIDFDSYSEHALRTRAWDPLIDKIEVVADDLLTNGPDAGLNPARVTVELADGGVVSELSTFPYDASGRSVLSGADVKQKFSEQVRRVLLDDEADELSELLHQLDSIGDLGRIGRLVRSFSDRTRSDRTRSDATRSDTTRSDTTRSDTAR